MVEHFPGVLQGGFGDVNSRNQSGNLGDSVFKAQFLNGSKCSLLADLLVDFKMMGGEGSNLGEMSYADDLMLFGELPELLGHKFSCFAAYTGVNLIKNQSLELITFLADGSQSEHNPGEFASRSNFS